MLFGRDWSWSARRLKVAYLIPAVHSATLVSPCLALLCYAAA